MLPLTSASPATEPATNTDLPIPLSSSSLPLGSLTPAVAGVWVRALPPEMYEDLINPWSDIPPVYSEDGTIESYRPSEDVICLVEEKNGRRSYRCENVGDRNSGGDGTGGEDIVPPPDPDALDAPYYPGAEPWPYIPEGVCRVMAFRHSVRQWAPGPAGNPILVSEAYSPGIVSDFHSWKAHEPIQCGSDNRGRRGGGHSGWNSDGSFIPPWKFETVWLNFAISDNYFWAREWVCGTNNVGDFQLFDNPQIQQQVRFRDFYTWNEFGINSQRSQWETEGFEVKVFCDGDTPPEPEPESEPSTELPPAGDSPMDCNCVDIEEMLRGIYNRLGVEQFPMNVPKTLYGKEEEQIDIEDMPSLWAWYIYQFDTLMGEFPITIKIKDADLTTEKEDSVEITLTNMAETLSELYGLGVRGAINDESHTNLLIKTALELISVKNAGIVTQDYVKANASFLGYRGNPKKRKIDYGFNPKDPETLARFLQNSQMAVTGWEEDDPETVVGFLQRIVFVSGILKAAFFRGEDLVNLARREVSSMVDDTDLTDEEWEFFLSQINDQNSAFNWDTGTHPRVSERGGNGDNNQ